MNTVKTMELELEKDLVYPPTVVMGPPEEFLARRALGLCGLRKETIMIHSHCLCLLLNHKKTISVFEMADDYLACSRGRPSCWMIVACCGYTMVGAVMTTARASPELEELSSSSGESSSSSGRVGMAGGSEGRERLGRLQGVVDHCLHPPEGCQQSVCSHLKLGLLLL
ncbi:hypothetical protein INR49_024552 [Caranx melampygus]|nr:hypothetical protein INR49_024552 [Caranx melampygus]